MCFSKATIELNMTLTLLIVDNWWINWIWFHQGEAHFVATVFEYVISKNAVLVRNLDFFWFFFLFLFQFLYQKYLSKRVEMLSGKVVKTAVKHDLLIRRSSMFLSGFKFKTRKSWVGRIWNVTDMLIHLIENKVHGCTTSSHEQFFNINWWKENICFFFYFFNNKNKIIHRMKSEYNKYVQSQYDCILMVVCVLMTQTRSNDKIKSFLL